MVVGEAPGADEERLRRPFVGSSGQLLDKWLTGCGQRRDAVWIGNVCVEETTPVLMADLTWKAIRDVKVGEQVLAFDEHGTTRGAALRKWRIATVLEKSVSERDCISIKTPDGAVTLTPDHKVLFCYRNHNTSVRWSKAGRLTPGISALALAMSPWIEEKSWRVGYLAGLFDGEGDLSVYSAPKAKRNIRVSFSNTNTDILKTGVQCLEALGFSVSQYIEHRPNRKPIYRVGVCGGVRETLRFLGTVKPKRLLDKAVKALTDPPVFRARSSPVLSLVPVGRQIVVDIKTTSGTFIANGFAVHNCNFRPPSNKLESAMHAWITDKAAKAAKFGCKFAHGGKFYNAAVAEGLIELEEEIGRVRPDLIVALGNLPLWALTGLDGIAKWRGSELWYTGQGLRIPLVPTFHPAYCLRVWEWNPIALHDLRVRAFGKMDDTLARETPAYRFTVSPTLVDVERWFEAVIVNGHAAEEHIYLAADIEGWGRVDCIGFATSARCALCIPVTRADGTSYWSEAEWPKVSYIIGQALTARNVRLIGQNFNYDAQCIEHTLGILPRVWFDTMAAQHLMLPGTPKDLAYLSSMYRRHYVYWKDDLPEATAALNDEAKWRYNCLDAVATYEVYERQCEALLARKLWSPQ